MASGLRSRALPLVVVGDEPVFDRRVKPRTLAAGMRHRFNGGQNAAPNWVGTIGTVPSEVMQRYQESMRNFAILSFTPTGRASLTRSASDATSRGFPKCPRLACRAARRGDGPSPPRQPDALGAVPVAQAVPDGSAPERLVSLRAIFFRG